MDITSQSLTPPGSPVAAFKLRTGIRSSSANRTGTDSAPVYRFSCKGPVVPQDKTFSPDGFFLRNEVFSAIKTLNPLNNAFRSGGGKPSYSFFGHKFDPTNPSNFKVMIRMCRKRIYALENAAKTTFVLGFPRLGGSRNTVINRNTDDLYSNSFKQRRDICTFLNFFVVRSRRFSEEELHSLFSGLIKSLGTARQWSSSLQHHCGSKDGDDCSSAEYHLFHVQLELRWSILLIFGMNQSVLNWVFDDLVYLALVKFKGIDYNVMEKAPFNCYCVKEIWAMLRHVVNHIKPHGRDFWDLLTTSVTRVNTDSEVYFPLWIMSNFVQLCDYEMSGAYNPPETMVSSESNCYVFINQLLDLWAQNGVKPIEVSQQLQRFVTYWGFDLNVAQTLWTYWVTRLDKGVEVRNVDHYSTPTKWFRLISWITKGCADPPFDEVDPVLTDAFLSFLRFLSLSVKNVSLKDWRKFKSAIFNRLSSKFVESLSELGLTRLVTLLLCLVSATAEDTQDMGERLNEILNYGKDSLPLPKFRGRCTMVLIFLNKSVHVKRISSNLMKSVDEVMGTVGRSPVQKELGIVYLDLLNNLPKYSPDRDLGQSFLICQNLTAWLSSSADNYVSRTLRVIHNLFEKWLLSSNALPSEEKTVVSNILQERTEQFLTQTIIVNHNRNPEFDLQPLAELAADFTFLRKSKQCTDAVNKLFDLFALHPRTSPQVSEIYMDRIISSSYFEDSYFAASSTFLNDIQLAQSWLRLVATGCSVPLKLSARVLNATCEESMRWNNELLLQQFCALIESANSPWSKPDLSSILLPLCNTIKCTVDKVYEADKNLISSVVRCSMFIVSRLKLDRIYTRNCQTGLLHEVLETYVPNFVGKPPWEKFFTGLIPILADCLPQLFQVIVTQENWMHDPFLKRKLCDIYRFAFFGFIKCEDLEDSNPVLLITQKFQSLKSSEAIYKEVMPSLQMLIKEDKLIKRFLLTTVGFLKRKTIPTSAYLLGFVTELCVEKEGEFMVKCTSIIANTWALMFGKEIYAHHVPIIIQGLQTVMNKHFSFRSKRFFDLFISLSKFSVKKFGMRKFMIEQIIPLLNVQIQLAENKQGSGTNFAMRSQLRLLEASLTTPFNV